MTRVDPDLISSAFRRILDELLAARGTHGHWEGELATSALSTATAAFALRLVSTSQPDTKLEKLSRAGADWLATHQNDDGGWGDTTRSKSNISTTTLCWAAISAIAPREHAASIEKARRWIEEAAGSSEPGPLSRAIIARYGKDRTFSIPILTMCALAGVLGDGREAWTNVLPLPFEIAALPHRWYSVIGLPVVSYALPALIAIGQVHHHHRPTWRPWRWFRQALIPRTLRTLRSIQPTSGGFLEATPLTSFVTMSLAGCDRADDEVVRQGVSFLVNSVRPDGSWPIDTNLATWCTTLSVGALADAGVLEEVLDESSRVEIADWLLDQQYTEIHPYTDAAPGGWAWTDLPGGVPDADDTPGALIALAHLLPSSDERSTRARRQGVGWLLDLQNRDGGIPTFCRGWGKLPFDRSGADLTAHALRAWQACLPSDRSPERKRVAVATRRALDYLARTQRADGSWTPLWFGNEHAPDDINPGYGTARVLRALHEVEPGDPTVAPSTSHARAWFRRTQCAPGGWGGYPGTPPSIEETALALEALQACPQAEAETSAAVERGIDWLASSVLAGEQDRATPIGFYFAKLWYYEKLYPHIFATAALGKRVRQDRQGA